MQPRFPFRYRAHEVSRLEAFSDVVFGFAITLIVVSLEVPKTYKELAASIHEFPSFALSFAVLLWIWHAHYTYFRRYALHDELTVIVNNVLLFVVLFYVYPLKFMFRLPTAHIGVSVAQARMLFTIYGGGFSGVFLLYVVLYTHALQLRDSLGLNEVEVLDTKTHIYMFSANVAIGVVSIALGWLLPDRLVGFAGFFYFAIGFASWFIGASMGAKRRAIEERLTAPERLTVDGSASDIGVP